MNNCTILSKRILGLSIILIMSYVTLSAQDNESSDFSYQINRVQKYVSISPAQLQSANILSDLNHFYKSDWVKEYKSVEITTLHENVRKKSISKDDQLTLEQKQYITAADIGSDIEVVVKYLPNNNLSNNKIEKMDFTFKIDPKSEAIFTGGEDKLDQYITKKILSEVTINDVPQYQVAAVKFTIDEDGNIVDANIAQPSQNEATDKLILEAICEMPKWQSATYSDGSKTKQQFVLTVGDQYSCTMNTLDIRSEAPPSTREK